MSQDAVDIAPKKAAIPRIIVAELIYVGLALSFNATSFVLRLNGKVPLAPTALVKATILFAIYLAVLFAGQRRHERTYRIGMALFVVVLPVIGIVPHLQRGFLPDLYHSPASWAGAIAINSFGIAVSAIGAIAGTGTGKAKRARSR